MLISRFKIKIKNEWEEQTASCATYSTIQSAMRVVDCIGSTSISNTLEALLSLVLCLFQPAHLLLHLRLLFQSVCHLLLQPACLLHLLRPLRHLLLKSECLLHHIILHHPLHCLLCISMKMIRINKQSCWYRTKDRPWFHRSRGTRPTTRSCRLELAI